MNDSMLRLSLVLLTLFYCVVTFLVVHDNSTTVCKLCTLVKLNFRYCFVLQYFCYVTLVYANICYKISTATMIST